MSFEKSRNSCVVLSNVEELRPQELHTFRIAIGSSDNQTEATPCARETRLKNSCRNKFSFNSTLLHFLANRSNFAISPNSTFTETFRAKTKRNAILSVIE